MSHYITEHVFNRIFSKNQKTYQLLFAARMPPNSESLMCNCYELKPWGNYIMQGCLETVHMLTLQLNVGGAQDWYG